MENILLLVVFVVLIGWMFFSSRRNRQKQKAAAELKATQMVPGARVMSRSGLFGTLVTFDADDLSKPVEVEIAPGVVVEMHSQAVELAPDAVADETDTAVVAEEPEVDETPEAPAAETPAAEAAGEFEVPEYELPDIDFGSDKDADKKD